MRLLNLSLLVALASSCALFDTPTAYDPKTVHNVETAILWAEEDGRLTREVLVARGATENELTSFDVRRESHVKRLKAWYAAEAAKQRAGGQPNRGEVHGAAAFAVMEACAKCVGTGQIGCNLCLRVFWHPHREVCPDCDGKGWVRK